MSATDWINPERLAALEAAAEKRTGTPWRANSRTPGARGGYACHFLIADVCIEAGMVEAFDVPKGNPRKMILHGLNPIFEYIDTYLVHRFRPVDPKTHPQAGDLVELVEGGAGVHVILVLGGNRFLHVMRWCGTAIHEISDPTWSDRIRKIRRPING